MVARVLPALAAACLLLPAYVDAVDPPAVTITRRGNLLRVATPEAMADVRLSRYGLRVRTRGGRLLTAEIPHGGPFWERGEGGVLHGLGRVCAVVEAADGVTLTVDTDEGAPAVVSLRWRTSRTLEVTVEPPSPESLVALGDRLRSPRREAIYGLTERLRDSPLVAPGVIDVPTDDVHPVEVGSLDRRGERVEMFVRPTFGLYAPFFQSSRGYGLAVDGTMAGVFDVAQTDPRVVAFRFETGNRAESQRLVFSVFAGPGHATILDEYTARTGRPIVPPDWAFLHWRWRDDLPEGRTGTVDGVTVHGDVASDLAEYADLGLPAGVWNFDRPVLEGEYGFARFAWNAIQLPNQDALLAALRQRGWRIMTWSGAWMCGANPGDGGYDAQQLGFIAPGPVGVPHCADVGGTSFILDVTNSAAQAWFRDRVAAFVAQYAIDAIKLDRGEEHIPSAATDVWADGRTGREVHNDYPTLQAKLHHDALRAVHPDGDFVLVTRAGYTGTAQYAIVWGGDIAGSESFGSGPGTDLGLRSAIISQQRAAFMGYPIWGSDTGGYYEFKDREVFARWLEFSCFSGIMEIGGKNAHAPWAMPTIPQDDPELTAIYGAYVRLRHALQPYVVAAAVDAGRGLPIVRPLPFLDPADRRLRDRWDEYLFGPDLLVAPVWKSGARARDVYFPRGTWRSYWNASEVVRGPATRTLSVPLDAIPVYVRDGATVPPPP